MVQFTFFFLTVVLATVGSVLSAQAGYEIGGEPVEVFSVKNETRMPWQVFQLASYPGAGKSLPEIVASQAGIGNKCSAVNANFYSENSQTDQTPIGLVVHNGRLVTVPQGSYVAVGALGGQKLIWDEVTVSAIAHYRIAGKLEQVKVCRFNQSPTTTCAAVFYDVGLRLGTSKITATALQLPSKSRQKVRPSISDVELTVELKGKNYGASWMQVTEAVSGSHVLFREGEALKTVGRPGTLPWAQARQPRTLLGADQNGVGWLAVFDGRSEKSKGVSVEHAWAFAEKKLGAAWAVNLDGGGSSTIVTGGKIINRPSDGFARAIAVGFGFCLSK